MQIPGPDPTSNESKFMGMGPKINLYFKKQASERTRKVGRRSIVPVCGTAGRKLFCWGYVRVVCFLLDRNFSWHKKLVHYRVRVSTEKNTLCETQPNLGHREHATWGICSARRPTSPSKMPGSCQNLQGEFCLLCEMLSRFQGSFRNTVTRIWVDTVFNLNASTTENIVISASVLFLWSVNRIPYIVKNQ